VTGTVNYTEIEVDAPLAAAFRSVGQPHFATVVSVGALVGQTTVILILMLGQSRVLFAMSRAGTGCFLLSSRRSAHGSVRRCARRS